MATPTSSLLILFGPPGCGKNFVGQLLKTEFNFYFYDADADLTPELIAAINKQEVFNESMREKYVAVVIDKITRLKQEHHQIAVAQALARNVNRQQLLTAFPDAHFVFIDTNEMIIDQRITQRNDWISVDYAKKIREIFEKPEIKFSTLDNHQEETHIIQQLKKIIVDKS